MQRIGGTKLSRIWIWDLFWPHFMLEHKRKSLPAKHVLPGDYWQADFLVERTNTISPLHPGRGDTIKLTCNSKTDGADQTLLDEMRSLKALSLGTFSILSAWHSDTAALVDWLPEGETTFRWVLPAPHRVLKSQFACHMRPVRTDLSFYTRWSGGRVTC